MHTTGINTTESLIKIRSWESWRKDGNTGEKNRRKLEEGWEARREKTGESWRKDGKLGEKKQEKVGGRMGS